LSNFELVNNVVVVAVAVAVVVVVVVAFGFLQDRALVFEEEEELAKIVTKNYYNH